MLIEKIVHDTTIFDLVNDINAFCIEYCIRENDDKCLELKAAVDEAKGSDDHLLLLSSYLSVAEDGDEIIEALYEFVSNCKGFCEPGEETTVQITKEDVNEVLDDCESKC